MTFREWFHRSMPLCVLITQVHNPDEWASALKGAWDAGQKEQRERDAKVADEHARLNNADTTRDPLLHTRDTCQAIAAVIRRGEAK